MKILRSPDPTSSASGTASRAVKCKVFSAGSFTSWDELFADAAAFATALPSGSLVNISHSDSRGYGVVAVWYWWSDSSQGE